MARNHGISMLPVVVLLGLIAAGGYNYHRNWQVEAAIPRPYAGYSQADLEALHAAYEAENSLVERQYGRAVKRLGKGGSAGMLDENIRAFENAQKRSSGSRALGVQLSMQQTATGEIAAEIARREEEGAALQLHLKRLLTI